MLGYLIFAYLCLGIIFNSAILFGGRHSSDYGTKQHEIPSWYVFALFSISNMFAWPVATWLMLRSRKQEAREPLHEQVLKNWAEEGGP